MKKNNDLYGIDLKYQYKTYKNVGKTYQIELKAKNNYFYKILGNMRKFLNKNEKRYKNFDTYSQWKDSIYIEINEIGFINKIDFLHYLLYYSRSKDATCEALGTIVTPIYTIILTMGITLFLTTDIQESLIKGFMFMAPVVILVLAYLLCKYTDNRKEFYFYKDLIEILV